MFNLTSFFWHYFAVHTTVDTSIKKQVSSLSNSEKAVLVILAALPSINPTRELLLIQEHLIVRHPKLFFTAQAKFDLSKDEDYDPNEYRQSIPLTQLGGQWAREANFQLLHIYNRRFDPFSVHIDEELYDEIAFKRHLREKSQDSVSVLDEKLLKQLGLHHEDEKALIEWASCFQEMLLFGNVATADRFSKKLSSERSNKANSGKRVPSKVTKPAVELRRNFFVDKTSLYETPPDFLAQTLNEVSYSLHFEDVANALLKILAIKELPLGTVSKLDFFAEEYNLQNCQFNLTKTTNSIILKIKSPSLGQSESQIMFDIEGNITNIYGIGEELKVGVSEW